MLYHLQTLDHIVLVFSAQKTVGVLDKDERENTYCELFVFYSSYNIFFKRHSVFSTNKNCPYFNAVRLKIHRYHNSRTHSSLIYIMTFFFLIAQLAFPFLLQGKFCHAYILVSLEFPFILMGRVLYSMNYEKVWLLGCAILNLKYEK